MRNLLTVSLLLAAAATLNAAVTGIVTTPDGKPLRNATVFVHEAKPKVGVGKQWDGLLICDDCAVRHVAKMRAEWEQVRRIAAGLAPDQPKV